MAKSGTTSASAPSLKAKFGDCIDVELADGVVVEELEEEVVEEYLF